MEGVRVTTLPYPCIHDPIAFAPVRLLLPRVIRIIGARSDHTRSATVCGPMIGTQRMGHVYPGATVPFGMVQLSPDTDTLPYAVDGKYNPEVYRTRARATSMMTAPSSASATRTSAAPGTFGSGRHPADADHRAAATEPRHRRPIQRADSVRSSTTRTNRPCPRGMRCCWKITASKRSSPPPLAWACIGTHCPRSTRPG
jgi:hypothetical protein